MLQSLLIRTLMLVSWLLVLVLAIDFVRDGSANVHAQTDNTIISATVPTEVYYTVVASPDVNEIGLSTTFYISVVTEYGIELPGYDVQLNLEHQTSGHIYQSVVDTTDSGGNVTFQLSPSKIGLYDITLINHTNAVPFNSNGVHSVEWADVVTPELEELPEIVRTKDLVLNWNIDSVSPYIDHEYYVEMSKNEDFTDIVENSGWISETTYNGITEEEDGQYYFRVRSKNSSGQESVWSNIVSTIIDNTPPVIVLEGSEISESGEIGSDTHQFVVVVDTDITDNSGVGDVQIMCQVTNSDERYLCGEVTETSGDTYAITIHSDQLRKLPDGEFYEEYFYCIEAEDIVHNQAEECGLYFATPEEFLKQLTLIERVVNVVKNVVVQTSSDIDKVVGLVVESISPEKTQIITTAVSGGVTGLGLWLMSFELAKVPYIILQGGMNLLVWLGLRKRRQEYGFVYNSVSKEPIPQVIVRAYNIKDELVGTSVTNQYGIFEFKLEAGQYNLGFSVSGYTFPSKIVVGKEDYPMENIYHGEVVHLSEQEKPQFAVPVDPVKSQKFKVGLAIMRNRIRVLMKLLMPVLLLAGLLLAVYMYRHYPNIWNLVVLLSYVPSIVIALVSSRQVKEKYGLVKDVLGQIKDGIVLGLRELEFDKLIGKRVTDSNGYYRFIVPGGEYKLVLLEQDRFQFKDNEEVVVEGKTKRNQPFIIAKDLIVEELPQESSVKGGKDKLNKFASVAVDSNKKV